MKKTIPFDDFFASINLKYYDMKISELKQQIDNITFGRPEYSYVPGMEDVPGNVYEGETKKYELKFLDRILKEYEKDIDKYGSLIYKISRLKDELEELSKPSALLDIFNYYLSKYTKFVNAEKALNTESKIKFKSHEKLENKATKISGKIYKIIDKKMRQLKLKTMRDKEMDSIYLSELMEEHSIIDRTSISALYNELKREYERYWLTEGKILEQYVSTLPKINKCLDNSNEVYKLDSLISSLNIYNVSHIGDYEKLVKLSAEYSLEFSRLGYWEIISKCREYITASIEWNYLYRLKEIFAQPIYELSDELVDKKSIDKLFFGRII